MTQATKWQKKFIEQQKQKANLLKLNGAKIMETGISTNKKFIYGIKDEDMGFISIFELPNDEIAKRTFLKQVNTSGTPFNDYPEKFSIYALAEMEIDTGAISGNLKLIVSGSEISTK